MAVPAVIVEGEGGTTDFTVEDSIGISNLTLMQLSAATITRAAYKTADATDSGIFAGIAASEKLAGDEQTNLGLYTTGIFNIVADGAIAAGQQVMLSGANSVAVADVFATPAQGSIVGIALGSIAHGSAGEILIGGRA